MSPKLSKWEKYLKNMEEKSIKNALEVTKELHNLYTQLHVISVKSCFRSVFVIFLKQTKWLFSACTVLIKKFLKKWIKWLLHFYSKKKKKKSPKHADKTTWFILDFFILFTETHMWVGIQYGLLITQASLQRKQE